MTYRSVPACKHGFLPVACPACGVEKKNEKLVAFVRRWAGMPQNHGDLEFAMFEDEAIALLREIGEKV